MCVKMYTKYVGEFLAVLACIVVFRQVKNVQITRGCNLKRISGATVMKCRSTDTN